MAVIEDLSDEEAYLLAILADPAGLDLAEFVWPEPDNEDGCWRAWPFQWKWWRDTAPLQIDQMARCLSEGTLVLTDRGHVPIETVRPGDRVLTHRGRWRAVKGIYDRGTLAVVGVRGHGTEGLIATPDHPFLLASSRRGTTRGDGHRRIVIGEPSFRPIEDSQPSDRWASPSAVEPPGLVPPLPESYRSGQQNLPAVMDEDFWWLVGLFVAEGSTSSSFGTGGRLNRVTFSVNDDEVELLGLCLKRLGLRFSVEAFRDRNGCNVKLNSKPLACWLTEHFGRNKRLPTWVHSLDDGKRLALLAGMVDGDGYQRSDIRWEYTTSSRPLALDVKILGQTLGYSASLSQSRVSQTTVIHRRETASEPAWTVGLQRLDSQPHVRQVDGLMWSSVSGCVRAGVARCWDLEVAEDHSFVAEGVVVHNSVGKTLSITLRMFAFPFLFPGQEAVITAPELVHLEPLTNLVEYRFDSCRLGREMLPLGRSRVTHRPFMMSFLNGSRIIGRIPQRDGRGVKGVHPLWLELDEACFPADTLILTRSGLIEISDVSVGDQVWTHRGRWRTVTGVHEKGIRDTVRVVGQGHPGLRLTPTHRLWAQRGRRWAKGGSGWEWIPSAEMAGNYWSSPLYVDGGDPVGPIPLSPTSVKGPLDHLDPGFLFLMGVWIAEGSTSGAIGGGPINRATWSVTPVEAKDLVERFVDLGLHVSLNKVVNTDGCVNVVAMLARWLVSECGSGAHNKTVPHWVFGLDSERRRAVLDGMVWGDGFACHDGRYAPGRWKFTTVSKRLLVGIRLLAQSLGYHVSAYEVPAKDRVVRGQIVHGGPSYEIVGATSGQGYDEDGTRLTKVRRIEPAAPVTVFDLTVEDDSSFVADGVIVHNSDYPPDGWTELIETLKRGHEGAVWRAHGVTRGIRDKFYEFTQDSPTNPWKVHRITAMSRPNWSSEEREEKIRQYGSRDHPDYRRNVLGLHGDAQNPLFVLHRLMLCADDDLTSDYNTDDYKTFRVNHEMLTDRGEEHDIIEFLDFPERHKKYDVVWVGMDVGVTQHPSEIMVFAETRTDKKGEKSERSVLRLITRIHLERVSSPQQCRAIAWVMDYYKPRAMAVDKTGLGLPLFQQLQENLPHVAAQIKGYGFSEKILVDFDNAKVADLHEGEDDVKEAGILKNVLEYSTDTLRELVDHRRLLLPWDTDLIGQFQGQTWCSDASTQVFTQRGWLDYNQVRPGDETLSIRDEGGVPVSEWTPIVAVNVFPAEERDMVQMTGQTHNSLTTLNHRWLGVDNQNRRRLVWKDTDDLLRGEHRRFAIPVASCRSDTPTASKYEDDFVELVAWYWTEGSSEGSCDNIAITQSPTANPDCVVRIEAMLERLLGVGEFDVGRGRGRRGGWSRTSAQLRPDTGHFGKPTHAYHIKDRELCGAVRAVAETKEKVVSPEFLSALTESQLDLFVNVSMMADGCAFTRERKGRGPTDVRSIKQKSESRIRSFEIACALRGLATHTRFCPEQGGWLLSILSREFVHVTSMKRTVVRHDGIVWCPTTAPGTWLARREGTVFYTGNSFSKEAMDMYGRRRRVYSQGSFHALDGCRMAVLGFVQTPIETMMAARRHVEDEPVFDGWVDM